MTTLPSALLPADSCKAITTVVLDFSRTPWPARKQANYLEDGENSKVSDPIVLALSIASTNRSPLDTSKNPKCFAAFS